MDPLQIIIDPKYQKLVADSAELEDILRPWNAKLEQSEWPLRDDLPFEVRYYEQGEGWLDCTNITDELEMRLIAWFDANTNWRFDYGPDGG